MKKKLLSICTLTIVCFGVNAQNVNIPDANFKAYLVGNTSINTNSDTEIQVSEAAAFTGTIQASNLGISDLTGIEAFPNITNLYCQINNLTSLDLSQNTVLTKIDASDNNLTTITLNQNQNTVLTQLDVYNNSLTSIDVSQFTALTLLSIPNNNITHLDLNQNTALETLFCTSNNLGALDISTCTNLVAFQCSYNNLTMLNMKNIITSTLTNFNATNNPNLTCIEVDDVAASTAAWTNIDATASYSLDCNPLGVDEIELSQSIFIYPNPVKSQIHINSDENIKSIDIIDVFGKTIKSNLISNNSIDVSNLSKGVYFLKVYTNNGIASKKFIKK